MRKEGEKLVIFVEITSVATVLGGSGDRVRLSQNVVRTPDRRDGECVAKVYRGGAKLGTHQRNRKPRRPPEGTPAMP